MNKTQLTEDDITPGSECPVCEEQIVTYFTRQNGLTDDEKDGQWCMLDADEVEPGGPMSEWTGDTIVIDHVGPSME